MLDYEATLEQAVLPLLQWYKESARELPWRTEPTPYRVWVSEIMLQQTRVAAVIDYFERFMAALPDVAALAAVPEDELLKLWQGLGYYNRARNLQKAAQIITADFDGEFPADYDAILSLPGIGSYTAGAIASIAYGIPVPAVDGNVLRVVSRILGDDRDVSRPDTNKAVRELLLQIIPHDAPGTFNQSLMELGATVCLPNGAPLCERCPVRELCAACREGRTAELPVKAGKKARRIEERTVWLIFHENSVALRRRPAKGLLAGLWEYPNTLSEECNALAAWKIIPKSQTFSGTGRHIFTHIEWHMRAEQIEAATEVLPDGWVWADRRALEQTYAVPNAFQCFLPIVEQRLDRGNER